MGFDDLDYLSGSEITSDFIPGGGVMTFVPGGDDTLGVGIPGKTIEGGKYIGVVRIWGGDRRLDVKFRIVDEELEEQRDYYFEGELFFSGGWESSVASWDEGIVRLPEGFTHTLRSYIELYLDGWDYDEINEVWWERYEDHY